MKLTLRKENEAGLFVELYVRQAAVLTVGGHHSQHLAARSFLSIDR
jgi:hypothetical protein